MSSKPMRETENGVEVRPEDRRQHKRRPVFWTGKLSRGHGQDSGISVNLMDISAGGARITMAEPMYGCPVVKLTIDRIGEFTGEVVWEGVGDIGIRFVDPGVNREPDVAD